MEIYKAEFSSTFENVNTEVLAMMEAISSQLNNLHENVLFKIKFMAREILNNAVEHGNHFNQHKYVNFIVTHEGKKITMTVIDEGEGKIKIPEFKKLEEFPDENLNSEEREYLLEERKRGYPVLYHMGFNIKVENNTVVVTIELEEEEQDDE